MVLLNSTMVPLGSPAHDFSLPGADGKTYSLASFRDKKVLVIVFMCNHCPYVKAVFDRILAIQNDYAQRGVQVVGINPNDEKSYPEDSMENMKRIVKEKKVTFPYLRDDDQEAARAYGAVCTPEIFVYGPDMTLLYRGRIDDNWQDENLVVSTDLLDAIDAILEDRPVAGEQHPSIGCSIKWL